MRKTNPEIILGQYLLQAPWWVSGVIGAVVLIIGTIFSRTHSSGLLPIGQIFGGLIKVISIPFFILAALSFLQSFLKLQLFKKVNSFDEIKALSWREFEYLVAEYYRHKGYKVALGPGAMPDGGIDVIAIKEGEKIIVQCKHWKAFRVDVKVVRELYGIMVDAVASKAVIMISGEFTQPAIEFAHGKPIELVNGALLVEMIKAVKKEELKPAFVMPQKSRAVLIPTDPPPVNNNDERKYMPPAMRATLDAKEKAFVDTNPICPKCQKPMLLRTPQQGSHSGEKFWGCPNYPGCLYTQPFVA